MKVDMKKAEIFKIRNRQGYACICYDHLTEGKTVRDAYRRMVKALRRSGIILKNDDTKIAKRLLKC